MTKLLGTLRSGRHGLATVFSPEQESWLIPYNVIPDCFRDNKLDKGPVYYSLERQPGWLRTRPCHISPVPDPELLAPTSSELRQSISHERRWRLIELGLSQAVSDEWLTALLSEVRQTETEDFWRACPSNITITSPLFQLANKEGRVALIKRAYAVMCSIPEAKVCNLTMLAESAIQMLNKSDYDLAQMWVRSPVDSEFYKGEYAKMISARAAEKVTADIFHDLGYDVQDIATQQLGTGTDWKTHDLLLDGKYAVDVKNARTPVSSRNYYVEHCVARFKVNRTRDDVYIAGVVSPYLSDDDIRDLRNDEGYQPKYSYNQTKEFIFLGVTSWRTIQSLEDRYSTPVLRLGLIPRAPETASSHSHVTSVRRVVPPWAYELPRKYYAPVKSAFETLLHFPNPQIPTFNMLREAELRPPYGLFIAANRPIPEDWLTGLRDWRREFIEELIRCSQLTLPVIYLTILRHFTSCAKNPPIDYHPDAYVDLIFYRNMPLGKTDPLGVISGLISNLIRVWERRETIGLSKFEEFRYQGLGILRGRCQDKNDYVTLIAYCGGSIQDKGKCGYNNLVLGDSNVSVCTACGRLVCPRCGYCDEKCSENARQAHWESLPELELEPIYRFHIGPPDSAD